MILHRLRQWVIVGGITILQLENFVCILVHLVLWRSGKTHKRRVEIGEDIAVFVVDGAVGFVADHQIKMPAGKYSASVFIILNGIYTIHHGLIGGENAVRGGVVLVLAEIGDREILQQVHKAALCLRDQRGAVG